MKIRVIQYGLGPIGIESAKLILEKSITKKVELVGAVEIDPAKAGKDLGEVLGLGRKLNMIVQKSLKEVLKKKKADVVLHTTSSFLTGIEDQLTEICRSGLHIVSSSEELLFPHPFQPRFARKLDLLARKKKIVVLGTGVNPGFVLDTAVLVFTGVCTDVRAVHAEREVDASKRRYPLQRKIGAGISVAEFEERKKTGTFGHIGMKESLYLVANGLGWKLDKHQESLEPMIATRRWVTPFLTVEPGQVTGIWNRISGWKNGKELITLDLKMYVGAENPHDAIHLESTPPIDVVVQNGVMGDIATVATLVNAIPIVMNASPGLKTMKDLPIPRAFAV